jgi:hypothetical protein
MDLLTLATACALSVEPKVMQALIVEQSNAQPWSFLVPGEGSPRVLPTIRDALREARGVDVNKVKIRVGLTGFPARPRSVASAMFVPCLNITLAAQQITQLMARCKIASNSEPIYCAIAAYHGSWDQPHVWFADAVRSAIEKANVPNVEMPQDAYFDPDDVALEMPTSQPRAAPAIAPDERERGWSSALFPAKSDTQNNPSPDALKNDPSADQPHSLGMASAGSGTSKTPVDGLFVPKASQGRAQ